jgi:hypothetical protein
MLSSVQHSSSSTAACRCEAEEENGREKTEKARTWNRRSAMRASRKRSASRREKDALRSRYANLFRPYCRRMLASPSISSNTS